MGKLKLNLDELAVEAFETEATEARDGTVLGHGPTHTMNCGSCEISCNGTCPLPCTGGFHSECCTDTSCLPSFEFTCGEACTMVCPE